jgi:hypothetical protein
MLTPLPSIGGSKSVYPKDYGYPLWGVYLVWIAVVVLLYPACLWYMRLKQTRRYWWLTYV